MFDTWINVFTNEIQTYEWINVAQIMHILKIYVSNVFSMHDINMWMYESWMNKFCIISIIKLWNVKFVM
jgi:hypothetical protein